MSTGIIQVVIFGRVFDGEVGNRVDDNRFEVFVRALNNSVIVARDVDYVTRAPVPFAPLTRKGLRANERAATNGLAQMEFGLVYHQRTGTLYEDCLR